MVSLRLGQSDAGDRRLGKLCSLIVVSRQEHTLQTLPRYQVLLTMSVNALFVLTSSSRPIQGSYCPWYVFLTGSALEVIVPHQGVKLSTV